MLELKLIHFSQISPWKLPISEPWSKAWPFPDLSVRNTTSHHNRKGIMTRHYNQYSNEYLDLFSRYRWQRITLYGVDMYENRQEALHVPSITKYHELYQPTFEELQVSMNHLCPKNIVLYTFLSPYLYFKSTKLHVECVWRYFHTKPALRGIG